MASFVCNKIKKDKLLVQALNFDLELGTSDYELVIVGHSLAAGVAAVLSIILKPEFPNIRCYAYSPPSGIVQETCLEDTKSFVISVIIGKDLVPRIGIFQTDTFRRHLLEALSACNRSKWRIICGAACCRCLLSPLNPKDLGLAMQSIEGLIQGQTTCDRQQTPMSIPGRIIHIIRSHPKSASYSGSICAAEEPVFQAIWAEYCDFNEILVSPTMISDHSPYVVYDALQKVLTHVSPTKPSRKPMKQRSCSMTPNSSSNVCDPPHSEFHLHQSDLEPEVTGRAITTLTLSQPISWRKTTNPTDVVEFCAAGTKDRPKNLTMLPRQHLIEIRRDDLLSSAPLASPEVLSETSSLASFGSGGGSIRQAGYQRLMTGTGKMDPIKQSPLSHSLHARGYSLILEPVQRKEERISANCFVFDPSSNSHRLLTRSSNELSRKTRDLDARSQKDDAKISAVSVAASSKDEISPVDDLDKNLGRLANSLEATRVAEIEIHEHKTNSVEDLLRTDLEPTETSGTEDIGAIFLNTNAPELSKETSETEFKGLLREVLVSNDSDRDSVESDFGRQYLYDDYVGHYSLAGRGYPHGFKEFTDECFAALANQHPDVGGGCQLVNYCISVCPAGGDNCGSHKVSSGSNGRIELSELERDGQNLIGSLPEILPEENLIRSNPGAKDVY